MKLSDWCIVFMGIFLCIAVPALLQERYDRMAQYTMEMYNRNLDRAAEDAMWDQVGEEYADGSIALDTEAVLGKFTEQLCLDYDIVSEETREKMLLSLKLQYLVNEREELSQEEKMAVADRMENTVNQNSSLTANEYALLFAQKEGESWSNPVENHSFYAFLEMPDQKNYLWTNFFSREAVRYSFSGSEIIKKKETE